MTWIIMYISNICTYNEIFILLKLIVIEIFKGFIEINYNSKIKISYYK